MESEKSEHVMPRAVAGATRMPSDGTDDDEVRERQLFLCFCVHCGQPNPVRGATDWKDRSSQHGLLAYATLSWNKQRGASVHRRAAARAT